MTDPAPSPQPASSASARGDRPARRTLDRAAAVASLAPKAWDSTVTGGEGDDVPFGGADDDFLNGGAGDDRIEGNGGDDRVRGGQGNDDLRGDRGSDILDAVAYDGGAFADVLDGGSLPVDQCFSDTSDSPPGLGGTDC